MKIVKIREEHYVEAVAVSQELGCTIGEGLRIAGARANAGNTNPVPPNLEPELSEPTPFATSFSKF